MTVAAVLGELHDQGPGAGEGVNDGDRGVLPDAVGLASRLGRGGSGRGSGGPAVRHRQARRAAPGSTGGVVRCRGHHLAGRRPAAAPADALHGVERPDFEVADIIGLYLDPTAIRAPSHRPAATARAHLLTRHLDPAARGPATPVERALQASRTTPSRGGRSSQASRQRSASEYTRRGVRQERGYGEAARGRRRLLEPGGVEAPRGNVPRDVGVADPLLALCSAFASDRTNLTGGSDPPVADILSAEQRPRSTALLLGTTGLPSARSPSTDGLRPAGRRRGRPRSLEGASTMPPPPPYQVQAARTPHHPAVHPRPPRVSPAGALSDGPLPARSSPEDASRDPP